MRRRVVLVGVAVVGAVAVASAWWWYGQRDRTTPVSPDTAVARFHASTTLAPPTAAGPTTVPTTAPGPAPTTVVTQVPDAGVYVYDTTGSESVDALGGATHHYPAVSTITVRPTACGSTQRWQPLEERWDEWTSCAGPGVAELRAFTGFHRFFGDANVDRWICAGDPRPVGAPTGTTWQGLCLEGTAPTTWMGTVLAPGTATVGATTVAVDRVAIDLVDGIAGDHQHYESWYLAGTDLLVQQTADMATVNSSAIGDVHYREQYRIALRSLVPRR